MLSLILSAAAIATATVPTQDPACITRATPQQLAERPSPLESVSFTVGAARVKVCYGAPSAKGRKVFGELVPYGQLWRTGANEPTMIHTSAPITVAGIRVPAGVVSLYTVPGQSEWEVIINKSVQQWGAERGYNDAIKAQEIGRGKVAALPEPIPSPVEKFVIRSEPTGNRSMLVLEWERTRIRIPVELAK
jgi:hypothetical protein